RSRATLSNKISSTEQRGEGPAYANRSPGASISNPSRSTFGWSGVVSGFSTGSRSPRAISIPPPVTGSRTGLIQSPVRSASTGTKLVGVSSTNHTPMDILRLQWRQSNVSEQQTSGGLSITKNGQSSPTMINPNVLRVVIRVRPLLPHERRSRVLAWGGEGDLVVINPSVFPNSPETQLL
ncbi:unnamed protein product, partial [Choristocarpus tenellus]